MNLSTHNTSLRALLVCTAVIVFCTGCSSGHYQRHADRSVYSMLGDATAEVPGAVRSFTIDTRHTARSPRVMTGKEIIADRLRGDTQFIDLKAALRLAATSSRDYQDQREALYLAGLSLTDERHRWRPQLSASIETGVTRTASDESEAAVRSSLTVSQMFKSGADLSTTLSHDLSRFYNSDAKREATSTISVDLTQPLLRGAGASVAAESLTQAQRDVIYEIRSFTRFQRTHAVNVASQYYRLLEQQGTVRNEYNNYLNLRQARARAGALARDRLPEVQVQQAMQDELSARNSYILAVTRYETLLDQFKLFLGVPMKTELRLAEKELTELRQLGLAPVALDEAAATTIAIANRLDLQTSIDRFEDARRQVRIAANDLLPDLDLFIGGSVATETHTDYSRLDYDQLQGTAGLRLAVPLDRLTERNEFRRSRIDFEHEVRNLELAVDAVRGDIRSRLRTLKQAKQRYDIQQRAVNLAERRVDNINTLLRAGRAEIRDLLESQSALVRARNASTRALIDYQLARLEFFRDMGTLTINDDGIGDVLPKAKAEATDDDSTEPTEEEPLITPDQLFGGDE